METDLFTVEKSGTFKSHDGTKSTFLTAGTQISANEARELGLLNDDGAKDLKDAAEQAKAQGSSDFVPKSPEAKAVNAAPENKAK
jgi:enoyl-CoA hydratase/carnithine racemase